MREATPRKMAILIKFLDDGSVQWHSAGWMNDKELMTTAKAAINQGENPDEVISLLSETFSVIIES